MKNDFVDNGRIQGHRQLLRPLLYKEYLIELLIRLWLFDNAVPVQTLGIDINF